MPYFSTEPSSDLMASMRNLVGGMGGGDGMRELAVAKEIAGIKHQTSLAEKARIEADALRNAEAARADPGVATDFATNAAGLDRATGTRLSNHLKGILEQPSAADIDDAAAAGKEAQPFVTGAPNITDGQRRVFQSSLAAAAANRLATGHTNAEQLAQAGGVIQGTQTSAAVQDAIARGEMERASAMNQGGKLGNQVKLYDNIGNTGAVFSPATGAGRVADAGLRDASIGALDALAGQRDALAAKRGGTGGGTGGATGDAATALPGGAGSHLVQHADSGDKYAYNEKTGKAWKANADGTFSPIPLNDLPKNVTKIGAGGATQGNREAVFTQRVVTSANQAAKDLANVVQLPLSASTGFFGGRKQGASLFEAGKEVLANKMTPQEAQSYTAMATGFQRSLASIESAGLMPSGSLTHQMDAVLFKEGDTNLTKLHKLAQTRQIIESGMEVLDANPRVSEQEKKKIRSVMETVVRAVPFTHEDLINLTKAQQIRPGATLADIVRAKKNAPGGDASPAAPAGWSIKKVEG